MVIIINIISLLIIAVIFYLSQIRSEHASKHHVHELEYEVNKLKNRIQHLEVLIKNENAKKKFKF